VADVVNAVRQSENWIHDVDSFCLKVEKITPPPQPGMMPSSQLASLKTESLEFAFDKNQVRFLCDDTLWYQLKIWNGTEAIGHEKDLQGDKEFYYFHYTPQKRFKGFISTWIPWLKSQPHSFWFDLQDTQTGMGLYGQAEDFYYTETTQYHGVECYVLSCDKMIPNLSSTWYVGVDDGRLYGIKNFKDSQPWKEYWMGDYKEVASGCWMPFTMGGKFYKPDEEGVVYLDRKREWQVTQCTVNQELSDELFKIDFKDGVTVYDHRHGHFMTYPYKADRTQQEWQELMVQSMTNKKQTSEEKTDSPSTDVPIQTISFKKDMPLVDTFRMLSEMYKVNIVPSNEIIRHRPLSPVSNLYDVTFEQALKAICGTTHTYEIKNSFVYVYTNEEYAALPKDVTLETAKKAIPSFFAETNKNISKCTILELGKLTTRDDGTKAIRCKCELKKYDGDTEIFDAMFFFDKTGKVTDYLFLQPPVKKSE
jgi:hypothetical protein